MVKRGEIWWANLPEPVGSNPGFRRPVLIIQSNDFNHSLLKTVIIATITSNVRLANMPGNVLLAKKDSKLKEESVVNITQLYSTDKRFLTERVSILSESIMKEIEEGLKLVLALPK